MTRPRGSGLVSDDEIAAAIERLAGTVITRGILANEVGLTEAGLKSRHRRLGLEFEKYLSRFKSFAHVMRTLNGLEVGDDGAVRGVVVKLAPPEADALLRLAKSEERPVQLQAQRLLRDGLRRAGVLPSRQPQPLRSTSSDAA